MNSNSSGPVPARRGPRLHPALHRLDRQRPLLAVADLDRRPGALRQRRAPAIHAHERVLGMPAPSRVLRRWRVDGRGSACSRGPPAGSARRGRAIPGENPRDGPSRRRPPPRRAAATAPCSSSISSASSWRVRNRTVSGTPAALRRGPVLRPLLGEIETHVDERMFLPRDVCHVDADLAVLDLAEPAAPLPRHADRLGPLLGEGRGIEHDHAVRLAQLARRPARRASRARADGPRAPGR